MIIVIHISTVKIVNDTKTHSGDYQEYNHRTLILGPQNPAQMKHVTKRKTESRIIEYNTWLHTQFSELLMMSE